MKSLMIGRNDSAELTLEKATRLFTDRQRQLIREIEAFVAGENLGCVYAIRNGQIRVAAERTPGFRACQTFLRVNVGLDRANASIRKRLRRLPVGEPLSEKFKAALREGKWLKQNKAAPTEFDSGDGVALHGGQFESSKAKH